MEVLRRQSLVEQTAQHLREWCVTGRLGETVPGVVQLAKTLSVSKDTVRAALRILEHEGTIEARGLGKCRTVTRGRSAPSTKLRVAVLLDAHISANNAHSQELIFTIKNAIEAAGHIFVICEKSIRQIRDVRQLARLFQTTNADAWIVYSGTRDVLEWFAGRDTPVLAIGGRALALPIASVSTDVSRAMAAAVDALVSLGHRRIVLVCGGAWRDPTPSPSARAFLDRLCYHGIKVSTFNLPDWIETTEGFERMMESLFRITAPTALLIVEPAACVAAALFLAQRGIIVPRDLSLVSILPDPAFSLIRPKLAHFEWTIPAIVNRAVKWVAAAARGAADQKAVCFHAKFRPAASLAAVKSG